MVLDNTNHIISCGAGPGSNICANQSGTPPPACAVPAPNISAFAVNGNGSGTYTYTQDAPPGNLVFTWADTNATTQTLTGAGTVTGTTATLPAPTTPGTTTYVLSASSCGAATPVSATISVIVTACTCDPILAAATCTTTQNPDTCGTANKCPGTHNPLCSDPANQTTAQNTCAIPADTFSIGCSVTCPGLKTPACPVQLMGCVVGVPYATDCAGNSCVCSGSAPGSWSCVVGGTSCSATWTGGGVPNVTTEPVCCAHTVGPVTSCTTQAPATSCSLATAVSISSGSSTICAVLTDGTMQCWEPDGYNNNLIGAGASPTNIAGFPTTVSNSAAGLRTCALVSGGVMCLGDDISASGTARPAQNAGGGPLYKPGWNYPIGLMQNGLAINTHTNYGYAESNATAPMNIASPAYISSTPIWVSGLGSGAGVTKVTSNCAIVSGTLQCWGENFVGQLGTGSYGTGGWSNYEGDGGGVFSGGNAGVVYPPVANVAAPTTVIAGGVSDVSSGGDLTCAVVSGGVQCAGMNEAGETGINPVDTHYLSNAHNSTNCVGIDESLSHATVAENVYFINYLAGLGITEHYSENTQGFMHCTPNFNWIPGLTPGAGVVQVEVSKALDDYSVKGGLFACALMGDGTVRCWGSNQYGQLGNGSVSPLVYPWWNLDNGYYDYIWWSYGNTPMAPVQTSPTNVLGFNAGDPNPVVSIHAGIHSMCAIKLDGSAWCWGQGDQLGAYVNNGSSYSTPAPAAPGIVTGSWTDDGQGYDDSANCPTDGTVGPNGQCGGNAPPCVMSVANPYASCSYTGSTAITCTDTQYVSGTDYDDNPIYGDNWTCGFPSGVLYTNTVSTSPVLVTAVPGPFTDIKPDVGAGLVSGHVFVWGPSYNGTSTEAF